MTETDVADLARRIAFHMDGDALWELGDVAAFLKCSKRRARDLSALPSFPPSYRIPNAAAHPRWKAKDIKQWAEKYREEA